MATTKDHSSNDGRLRVGVLVLPPVQLLDLSPIDLFSMMTPEYLAACQLPAPLIALGIPVQIEYIASSGSKSLAELTANLKIAITASLTDPAVAPGKLDILLIPGPDPGRSTAEEEKVFIRGHTEKAKAVMTVCTGVFPAADSGILDGKSVTAPRALIPMLKERYKDVKWVEKRWATDGNIWTSGGITNGLEMVAAYLRETWLGALSDTVLALADIGWRPESYETSSSKETAWWIWLITRAWGRGLFGKK